jgi:hypothetical protein
MVISTVLKTRFWYKTKDIRRPKDGYEVRTGFSLICGEKLYKMDIMAVTQQYVLLCRAVKKIFGIFHKQEACILTEET